MKKLIPLLLLVVSCGIIMPVKHATPGGLTIVYDDPNDGRYRLPREKVREIDERHAALLACLPRESLCTREHPQVQIRGGNCDSFMSGGQRIRGEYFWGRAVVPGSLGALAHEMAHHYTCETHGPETWVRECGDKVDGEFRRLYPPKKCEGDR